MHGEVERVTEGYVLSVTQLNEYVNSLIRNDILLGSVSIRGEISGFKRHSSGHVYFSLKDESSLVRCVMFKQNAVTMPAGVGDGMQVVLSGYASLYTRDGQFQFYVKSMQREGEGELYRRFLMLKTRLEAQGLFDSAHKKPLPRLPKCIGAVTSKTGAALQDIINITRRRFPMMDILVAPSAVQGVGAAQEIAKAIKLIDQSGRADVIIVGRGGGSIEELWAFNEEAVARAIYECKTPIVSAVGHETDFTIADFVADLRAPTPSAAAELCVPEYEAMNDALEYCEERLYSLCKHRLEDAEKHIAEMQRSSGCGVCSHVLERCASRLEMLSGQLTVNVGEQLKQREHALEVANAKLASLSPERTLERGFALVKKGKSYASSAEELKAGDNIEIRFASGSVAARVTANIGKEEE